MTELSPRTRVLAFVLPASLGPIVLGLASVWVMHQTPRLLAFQDENAKAEEVTPKPDKRVYLPLDIPVTLSLPNGGGTLTMSLGIALREKGSLALMARLSDRQQEAQAGLAAAVLHTAETLEPDAGLDDLRVALPESLLEALNARLITMGEEPAILEVLILAWAHAP
jgi:flagellar basal body-associated protein FliL